MKEKIENKINEYINAILKNETIDYQDYLILTGHLGRLKSEEDAIQHKKDLAKMIATI